MKKQIKNKIGKITHIEGTFLAKVALRIIRKAGGTKFQKHHLEE